MHKKLVLPTLFLFLLAFSGFRAATEWIEYKSAEGKYRVLMPGIPEEEIKELNTAVGKLNMYIALLESDEADDNLIYMTAFSEYPADKINSDMSEENLDNFFKGAANGSAENMNGKVDTIMVAAFKNYPYPCRYIKTSVNLGGIDLTALQKLILVKNKFYILQTFTKPGAEENANAKKFFESMDLIP